MPNLSRENEQRLHDLIAHHDLVAAKDIIVAQAFECAVLILGDRDTYLQVGNSRYGGDPDLPASIDWPRSDKGYLSFLMQVNFAELPTFANSPLPSQGFLYFFIEEDESCTDVIAQVLFHDGDSSSLRRVDPPPIEHFAPVAGEQYTDLNPYIIHPRLAIDLRSYGSQIYDQVDALTNVTDAGDGGDRYFKLIDDAIGKSDDVSRVGQLLGFSSELNGDMRENACLAHTGHRDKIYNYKYRKDHHDELAQAADEWRLLWRIDSDFSVGVCIWDAGSYFVMIRHEDLKRRDFRHTYTEIETG